MPRYVALLRGINVGGHVVRMEQLRSAFREMGFTDVATFIASGNVVFSSDGEDPGELERRIEERLPRTLGFDAATFLRSPAELAGIAGDDAFPGTGGEGSLNVVFLRARPDRTLAKKLLALGSDTDSFQVRGREVYWLARKGTGQSPVMGQLLKVVGRDGTTRNLNTVPRLGKKFGGEYPAPSSLTPDPAPATRTGAAACPSSARDARARSRRGSRRRSGAAPRGRASRGRSWGRRS